MKPFLFWIGCGVLIAGALFFAVRGGYLSVPFASATQPSLTRAVLFSRDFSDVEAERVRDKVETQQSILRQNQNDIDAWLDLAIQYKEAGDFEGARQVWEYMEEAFPQQDTSAFNLGVLYHQDLARYSRSEKSYREAMRRNPGNPLNYLGLHELYRNSYKRDTSAAVDVLLEGMESFPNDPNFPIALAAYYRDYARDYEKAIQYIAAAKDLVEASGDLKKAEALQGEIERLTAALDN